VWWCGWQLSHRATRAHRKDGGGGATGWPAGADPRRFVERDGQHRALDKGGTDIHHYAKDYLPIAGSEIARALGE